MKARPVKLLPLDAVSSSMTPQRLGSPAPPVPGMFTGRVICGPEDEFRSVTTTSSRTTSDDHDPEALAHSAPKTPPMLDSSVGVGEAGHEAWNTFTTGRLSWVL
jgi:hypothetical protein